MQKNGETLCHEWLQNIAQDRARAAGDPEWEPKLCKMIRTTKENAINRKLSLITQGPRGVLDRIQILAHNWFSSQWNEEIYHYANGVFEAYPSAGDGSFYTHHTLKVLSPDAQTFEVTQDVISRHLSISNTSQLPWFSGPTSHCRKR